MRELTEREEREMIDKAKAGDPEANYNMSLWALDRAMADPGDERWNRLAAKCLVRAAEGGYEPARRRMEGLLHQTPQSTEPPVQQPQPAQQPMAGPQPTQPAARPQATQPAAGPQPRPRPAPQQQPRPASGSQPEPRTPSAQRAQAAPPRAPASGGKRTLPRLSELTGRRGEKTPAAGQEGQPKKRPLIDFSRWGDAEWKRARTVCLIVGALLAVLIAILIFTRQDDSAEPQPQATPTADAAQVLPATPTPVPTPEPYPDEATRAEIAAASLQVYPAETDYVSQATSATVSTNGGDLNLRGGPSSGYNQLASIENGTALPVYAYKNGWALVKHGNTWGWCSGDYLKLD